MTYVPETWNSQKMAVNLRKYAVHRGEMLKLWSFWRVFSDAEPKDRPLACVLCAMHHITARDLAIGVALSLPFLGVSSLNFGSPSRATLFCDH
jgi:hypothetical protein